LALENINAKNSRNVLTANNSRPTLTIFGVNLKMTPLNNETKMTKSISQKVIFFFKFRVNARFSGRNLHRKESISLDLVNISHV